MIKVKNLFLKYVRQYYALYDINFEIEVGESVAFVGEENSGKTSLMRILCKLEEPTKGEIYIKNIPLKKIDFSEDVSMGYLPVKPVFFEGKTVYQNLLYVLKLQKFSKSTMEKMINDVLIEFNIERLKDMLAGDLSLFDKYLVSIARLSLRKLDILLVDNFIDFLQQDEVEKIIEILSKRFINKETIFILSTQKEELAKRMCKRKIHFENGSIIKERPRNEI